MKGKYRISSITHSGRKGERHSPVTDFKYNSLIGSVCIFDPFKVRAYESLHFPVYESPVYDWWDTSEVIALDVDTRDDSIHLETVNTIYVFEKIGDKNG